MSIERNKTKLLMYFTLYFYYIKFCKIQLGGF